MTSQWLHIETFSKSGKQNTIRGVIGEALRETNYTNHIKNPKPPTMVLGSLETIEADIDSRYATGKDALGRKVRKDAHLLLAGTASYPVPLSSKAWKDDPFEVERFNRWKALTLDFLKKEYGTALRAVLLHEDEGFPHFHFYAVPEGNSMTAIHRGNAAKAAEKDKTKQLSAYKAALVALQDDYFKEVGSHCGFSRLGPGRRRLSRQEWLEEKSVNRLATDCLARQQVAIKQSKAKLETEKQALHSEKQRVQNEALKVEREKEELDKAWLAVAAEKTRQNEPQKQKPAISDDELAKFGL